MKIEYIRCRSGKGGFERTSGKGKIMGTKRSRRGKGNKERNKKGDKTGGRSRIKRGKQRILDARSGKGRCERLWVVSQDISSTKTTNLTRLRWEFEAFTEVVVRPQW